MKRNGTKVLVVTDNLTSHTTTVLVKSEKAEDIQKALIQTILPYQTGGTTSSVRVDTALGLKKLINNPKKLQLHNIILDPGRQKNKNSNTIVDS